MSKLKNRPWLSGCLLIILLGCGLVTAVSLIYRQPLMAYSSIFTELFKNFEYASGLDTPEAILDYLAAEPQTAALVSYTVDEQGNPIEDGTALYHNPDEPMVLASTMKIVVLAVYAQAEASGLADPQEQIALAEWDSFYLPGTDGGAHAAALANLDISTNEQGFARNPEQVVALDDLVWAMMRYSDNAATDYLIARFGFEALEETINTANLSSQESIPPLAGLFLSWQNHENPTLTDERVAELLTLTEDEIEAEAAQWATLYTSDEAWRTAELAWRKDGRYSNVVSNEMALANALPPAASARDYAAMMGQIATGNFISADVSAVMRRYLEWPLIEFEENQRQFSAFGTKGGSLASILTEASYIVPKTGEFAGQTRVVVLFQNDMPFSAWLTQSQTFAQQQFIVKLATEQSFVETVQTKLTAVEE